MGGQCADSNMGGQCAAIATQSDTTANRSIQCKDAPLSIKQTFDVVEADFGVGGFTLVKQFFENLSFLGL